MYVMVNRFANVYSNLNQFYMAGLMTAPIVVIDRVVPSVGVKRRRCWN
jgi:hypothetical protein